MLSSKLNILWYDMNHNCLAIKPKLAEKINFVCYNHCKSSWRVFGCCCCYHHPGINSWHWNLCWLSKNVFNDPFILCKTWLSSFSVVGLLIEQLETTLLHLLDVNIPKLTSDRLHFSSSSCFCNIFGNSNCLLENHFGVWRLELLTSGTPNSTKGLACVLLQ